MVLELCLAPTQDLATLSCEEFSSKSLESTLVVMTKSSMSSDFSTLDSLANKCTARTESLSQNLTGHSFKRDYQLWMWIRSFVSLEIPLTSSFHKQLATQCVHTVLYLLTNIINSSNGKVASSTSPNTG